jgi:hypothetical protein
VPVTATKGREVEQFQVAHSRSIPRSSRSSLRLLIAEKEWRSVPAASRVKTETIEHWLPATPWLPRSSLREHPGSGQESQPAPPAPASVSPQRVELRGRHHDEIRVLWDMARNAIEAVDPRRAHRARTGLLLPEHEVVHDGRTSPPGEELGEPHDARRVAAGIEGRRGPDEVVVLHMWAMRQRASEPCNALSLVGEVELGDP